MVTLLGSRGRLFAPCLSYIPLNNNKAGLTVRTLLSKAVHHPDRERA